MPKPTTSGAAIVQARTSFTANTGTHDFPVVKGDLADANSDVARKYPDMFEPVTVRFVGARIEQATAAPGEKRGA